MNVHHLELFYYVARHGGIAEAVRRMPYGIQQPAISSQILQLEETLEATLFRRRPFALTPAGKELFAFIEPFFSNLISTADRIRGGGSQKICIGASQTVLRDYLPSVLADLRSQFPRLQVRLFEGFQHELIELLQSQEIDLAVTSIDPAPPAPLKSKRLLDLPLVLLVRHDSPLRSTSALWKRDRIEETLVSLPPEEAMCRAFQKGLARQRVEWVTGIEVSSVQLIQTYVERGFGYGLCVAEPDAKIPRGIRALPVEGFPEVRYGAVWQGRLSRVAEAALKYMEKAAASMVR